MTERVAMKTELPDEADVVVLDAARSLARALGQTSAYKDFEAANERFRADEAARQRLVEFVSRQRQLQLAAMWGGVGAEEKQAFEREWQALREIPTLDAYFRAQERFTALLRESAGMITEAMGVDYGAACSPSGGCR